MQTKCFLSHRFMTKKKTNDRNIIVLLRKIMFIDWFSATETHSYSRSIPTLLSFICAHIVKWFAYYNLSSIIIS